MDELDVSRPCGCYNCARDRGPEAWAREHGGHSFFMSAFFACSKCGNKRCPHATDHRLTCTKSNEPGQKGSRYE